MSFSHSIPKNSNEKIMINNNHSEQQKHQREFLRELKGTVWYDTHLCIGEAFFSRFVPIIAQKPFSVESEVITPQIGFEDKSDLESH
jgi:hypothetical protein